jgi:abortive infection bacteriophage resistance protein
MHTWGVFSFSTFLYMDKKEYCKQPLSYAEQLKLVQSRGLIVEDEPKALKYFQQISYYRLSAFFLPYQQEKDKFNKGVTFKQILDTYSFDRELRLLVFDCIERIEITIRTQIIYALSSKYKNSHWQDDKSIFKSPYKNYRGDIVDPFGEAQKIITSARLAKNPEVFIKHYADTYSKPLNPPSWMSLELFTIGELSRLYNGLQHNEDKQLIARFFGLHYTVFVSWLHTLTYVRNICAHHSRLWNRAFAIKPDILLKPKHGWIGKPFENNQRTFYFLCTLQYWLKSANPSNHLKLKLDELFKKHPTIPIQFIGIPSDGEGNLLDWQNEALWQ